MSGDGAKQPRVADRRTGSRRAEDLERRLAEVEHLARANRRELELQFQRMAHMQAELDMLLRLAREAPARSSVRHGKIDDFEHPNSSIDPLTAGMARLPGRPRS
jgi:hypothetical protein